jgi:tRNA threonylcarbamoyl adenosine modification protein (Sua5/YciO/YrdC/YwlC family)
MILKVHPENPAPRHLKQIIETIKQGGIIIIPTDSVYAIAWDIHNTKAYERILQLKGIKKKEANFSFLFFDLSQLSEFTLPFSNSCFKAIKKSLPGPFTFILNANNKVPKIFQNKKKTIGIRIPDNLIVTEIINELGTPLMTTSIKGDDDFLEYMTDPELIHEKFEKLVDLVVDGGIGDLTPSTVVSCVDGEIDIVRQGKGIL